MSLLIAGTQDHCLKISDGGGWKWNMWIRSGWQGKVLHVIHGLMQHCITHPVDRIGIGPTRSKMGGVGSPITICSATFFFCLLPTSPEWRNSFQGK